MQAFNRLNEVEKLFYAALDQDPAHRKEFLCKTCNDPEVLAEVISLLDAHESGNSTLDRPPEGVIADLFDDIEERLQSLVGSSFDHYEITGLLGKGAMGRVYLAQDSRLMRKVAVKLLPASQVHNLDGLRRFAQEARLASGLNHPNIITVYDYGEAFSSYFIATEYVEGETLRPLIERRLDMEKALDISIQIASAMAAAHRSGIIHRDIKPENIMVRADGLVKVLDFGLAKTFSRQDSTGGLLETAQSVPGAIIGTFYYMSPEQACGQQLDARTDVFSFGIVLYEMLAGRRPFSGDTLPDLLDSLVRKDAPPLSTFAPEIPADLEEIVARTLARDLDERYQTFEAVLSDLSALKKRVDIGERLEPASHRAAGSAAGSEAERGPDHGVPVSGSKEKGGVTSPTDVGRTISSGMGRKGYRSRALLIIPLFLLAGAVSYEVGRVFLSNRGAGRIAVPPPTPSQPARVTTDPTTSIDAVAVSRDRQYFACVQQHEVSIFSMSSAAQERLQKVRGPLPSRDYTGLTFSNDGSFLYFVTASSVSEAHSLYRIPVQGDGAEEKIKDDVNKSISFSPDGSRFAFVRNSKRALMIANSDGSAQRTLCLLSGESEVWLYPAWSPDNKVIVCGVMNQTSQGQRIYSVSLQDGSRKPIGEKVWVRVLNLAWMADGHGFVASASEDEAHSPGLWYISYPAGVVTQITNDPYGYYGASLTADSRTLLSVRADFTSHLFVAGASDGSPPKELNLGLSNSYGTNGLCWAPDGKIVYNAGPIQRKSLYDFDPGSTREEGRRLTFSGPDSSPCVTPDNRYIVFASDRSGKLAVWRMDRDGGNPRILADQGLKPSCLLDGRYVVYQVVSGDRISLWTVPIDGGTPSLLSDPKVNSENAAVSPDGKRVAFLSTDPAQGSAARPEIAVYEGGRILPVRYPVPSTVRQPIIHWRDDHTLSYIDEFGNREDIWLQRLGPRSAPRLYDSLHTDFKRISNFDWFRDGRILLSAEETQSAGVYKLTLDPHSK